MAGEFISISSMMQHMNNGLPFSMAYVTFDKATGRGGAVKQVDMAVKCWPKEAALPGLPKGKEQSTNASNIVRNPNHFFNSTVNIRISAAGHTDIRKVHVQLIRLFNGAIVK